MSLGAPTLPDCESTRLSTDYLNRYAEALMLIEMAPCDDGVVSDLAAWRPVGYREHFVTAPLRCAPSALDAYDALAPASRDAFDELCRTMDRLIATATALLHDRVGSSSIDEIVQVAAEALRALIERATRFINANGRAEIAADATLQTEIDALFAA